MKKSRVLIKHSCGWGLDEGRVKGLALEVLGDLALEGVELSLLFVGAVRARKLNWQYRKMDYTPQVLSFAMRGERDGDGLIRIGDVLICGAKLKYEARFLRKGVYGVLREWLEHGVGNLI